MNQKEQLKRQAYIDNQLSVAETIDFEERLTDDERRSLEAEARFEAELARKLNDGPGCPEHLWQTLRGQLQQKTAPAPAVMVSAPTVATPPMRLVNWPVLGLAAAVVLNLIVGALLLARLGTAPTAPAVPVAVAPPTDVAPPSLPLLNVAFSDDLTAFAAGSSYLGDCDKLCQCLKKHGFDLAMARAADLGIENVKLLGWRYEELDGKPVARMFFAYNGQPVAIFVAAKDGAALRNLDLDGRPGPIQTAIKEVGNYRIMAVSPAAPAELLALFTGA